MSKPITVFTGLIQGKVGSGSKGAYLPVPHKIRRGGDYKCSYKGQAVECFIGKPLDGSRKCLVVPAAEVIFEDSKVEAHARRSGWVVIVGYRP